MTAGYVVLALGTLLAVLVMARDRWGALLGLGAALGAVVLGLSRTQPPRPPNPAQPKVERGDEFVGSAVCVGCHAAEHDSWWRSYHRSMTQTPDARSVAPRLPVRLELDGRTYELTRQESGAIDVHGPDLHRWAAIVADVAQRVGQGEQPTALLARAARDLPRVRRELVLVTGSHHYQAFWVEGGAGRELRQLPFVYLLDPAIPEEERWLPRRDAFLQPPDALPHVARWNANCVQCHSVGGRPQHSEEPAPAGTYDTSVADFGIGCEACHGPGAAHVAHYQSPVTRYVGRGAPRDIVNPARLDAARSSAACGQCHSYFVPRDAEEWWSDGFADSFRPGDELDGARLVLDYELHRDVPGLISRDLDSVFWPDGTIRVGGREYNGLVKSPCFATTDDERRIRCVSCHSMHASDPEDQLAEGMDGPRACTQCHTTLAERVEEHTHHAPSSPGSDCYNCHMPRTTYALLKGIRSHRVTSPRVDATPGAAPNACNLCHLDRGLSWTRRWLAQWWGAASDEPAPTQRDTTRQDLALAPDELPASVRWLLSGNAAQRVLLADALAWAPAVEASGAEWQRAALLRALDDPYAAVRYVARRSLRRLEGAAPTSRAAASAPTLNPRDLDALISQRDDIPITISE